MKEIMTKTVIKVTLGAALLIAALIGSVNTSAYAAAGGCKKCGCLGFRGDSGTPEKCININNPTKGLCGHSKGDHK
jgi:hypothetical protein